LKNCTILEWLPQSGLGLIKTGQNGSKFCRFGLFKFRGQVCQIFERKLKFAAISNQITQEWQSSAASVEISACKIKNNNNNKRDGNVTAVKQTASAEKEQSMYIC